MKTEKTSLIKKTLTEQNKKCVGLNGYNGNRIGLRETTGTVRGVYRWGVICQKNPIGILTQIPCKKKI